MLYELLKLFESRGIRITQIFLNGETMERPNITVQIYLAKDRINYLSGLIGKMEFIENIEVLEEKVSYK